MVSQSSRTEPVSDAANGNGNDIDETRADSAEVHSAIERYTSAAERRLKPGLDAACEQRDKLYSELEKIDVQQHSISTLKLSSPSSDGNNDRITTSVNIGEEFYVAAEVDMSSKKLVLQLTEGIYVELTIVEAERILGERKVLLEKLAGQATERIVGIQAHLKAVLTNVAKLRNALGEMKREEIRTERILRMEEDGY